MNCRRSSFLSSVHPCLSLLGRRGVGAPGRGTASAWALSRGRNQRLPLCRRLSEDPHSVNSANCFSCRAPEIHYSSASTAQYPGRDVYKVGHPVTVTGMLGVADGVILLCECSIHVVKACSYIVLLLGRLLSRLVPGEARSDVIQLSAGCACTNSPFFFFFWLPATGGSHRSTRTSSFSG